MIQYGCCCYSSNVVFLIRKVQFPISDRRIKRQPVIGSPVRLVIGSLDWWVFQLRTSRWSVRIVQSTDETVSSPMVINFDPKKERRERTWRMELTKSDNKWKKKWQRCWKWWKMIFWNEIAVEWTKGMLSPIHESRVEIRKFAMICNYICGSFMLLLSYMVLFVIHLYDAHFLERI